MKHLILAAVAALWAGSAGAVPVSYSFTTGPATITEYPVGVPAGRDLSYLEAPITFAFTVETDLIPEWGISPFTVWAGTGGSSFGGAVAPFTAMSLSLGSLSARDSYSGTMSFDAAGSVTHFALSGFTECGGGGIIEISSDKPWHFSCQSFGSSWQIEASLPGIPIPATGLLSAAGIGLLGLRRFQKDRHLATRRAG